MLAVGGCFISSVSGWLEVFEGREQIIVIVTLFPDMNCELGFILYLYGLRRYLELAYTM